MLQKMLVLTLSKKIVILILLRIAQQKEWEIDEILMQCPAY